MKKILFTMLMGSAIASNAQTKIGYALALKGEAIFTTIQTDVKNTSYQSGFGGGAGVLMRLKVGKVYFQPELKYSSQATTRKDSANSRQLTFSSVDIPILLGGYLFNRNKTLVRILAGPELSFFNSFKLEEKDIFNPRDKSNIRSGFMAFAFGAGVDYKNLTFDLRYKLGTNSVIRKTTTSSPNEIPRQIVFSVGYKFLYKED